MLVRDTKVCVGMYACMPKDVYNAALHAPFLIALLNAQVNCPSCTRHVISFFTSHEVTLGSQQFATGMMEQTPVIVIPFVISRTAPHMVCTQHDTQHGMQMGAAGIRDTTAVA